MGSPRLRNDQLERLRALAYKRSKHRRTKDATDPSRDALELSDAVQAILQEHQQGGGSTESLTKADVLVAYQSMTAPSTLTRMARAGRRYAFTAAITLGIGVIALTIGARMTIYTYSYSPNTELLNAHQSIAQAYRETNDTLKKRRLLDAVASFYQASLYRGEKISEEDIYVLNNAIQDGFSPNSIVAITQLICDDRCKGAGDITSSAVRLSERVLKGKWERFLHTVEDVTGKSAMELKTGSAYAIAEYARAIQQRGIPLEDGLRAIDIARQRYQSEDPLVRASEITGTARTILGIK